MKAVIYARYSSDKQRAESIEDQERVCREYAARNGFEVVEVYSDKAQSGTKDTRENFQRMIKDAKKGEWSAVIVYKLDRFARDRFASAIYKKALKDCGCRVVSATEAIPDTPEGVLLESVIEGTAEFYSRQLGQNTRRGMLGNARKCKANGVTMYGYRIDSEGFYEVEENEARNIRAGFDMRESGYSIGAIANELAPRMGKTYKQAYNIFAGAFKNPKYSGVYKWGEIEVAGGMPAIVSPSQFARVSNLSGKVRYKAKRASYPLAGRIFGADRARWHGESAQSRGKTYYYYSDGVNRIRADKLEERIYKAVVSALSNETILNRIVNGIVDSVTEEAAPDLSRLPEARKELRNLVNLGARIGFDSELESKIVCLRGEIEELELLETSSRIAPNFTPEAVGSWLRGFLEREQAQALELFVNAVRIDYSGSEIENLLVFFTFDNEKGEAPERFAFDKSGTPKRKNTKLQIIRGGFVLSA